MKSIYQKVIYIVFLITLGANASYAKTVTKRKKVESTDSKSNPKPKENTKESAKDPDFEKTHKKKKNIPNDTSTQEDELKSRAPEHTPSDKKFGVGINLGSNAVYGNSATFEYSPFENLEIQTGLGYNTTGFKVGLGSGFVLPISSFGLTSGFSIVHSNGTKDKVTLPAKFIPEGSSTEENVNVSKEFTLTPANYLSFYLGGFFDFIPSIRINGKVNYNKVISGNDVVFDGQAQYDKPIDATNETEVEADFDPKATKKLDINGLGFSVGIHFRF